MVQTLQILIADADTLVHAGLAAVFAREADMQVVGHAQSAQQALDLYRRLQPDVLILETMLPDMSGQAVIAALCRQSPDACILVLSRQDAEEAIYQALQAGARGYHLKEASAQSIVHAVRLAYAGQTTLSERVGAKLAARLQRQELTPRERQVLEPI